MSGLLLGMVLFIIIFIVVVVVVVVVEWLSSLSPASVVIGCRLDDVGSICCVGVLALNVFGAYPGARPVGL
jgi:hypothetical protein